MALEKFDTVEALKADLIPLIISTCDLKNINPEDIRDDDLLINGEGALKLESIDAVDIVVAIERRYGIRIEDLSSARQYMRSIQSLAEYLYPKQKGTA